MMSGSLSFKKLAYLRRPKKYNLVEENHLDLEPLNKERYYWGISGKKKKVESVFIFCIKAQTENEWKFCLKKCSKARPALDVCRVYESCADVIGRMGAQNNNIAIYLAFTFQISVFHNLVS